MATGYRPGPVPRPESSCADAGTVRVRVRYPRGDCAWLFGRTGLGALRSPTHREATMKMMTGASAMPQRYLDTVVIGTCRT